MCTESGLIREICLLHEVYRRSLTQTERAPQQRRCNAPNTRIDCTCFDVWYGSRQCYRQFRDFLRSRWYAGVDSVTRLGLREVTMSLVTLLSIVQHALARGCTTMASRSWPRCRLASRDCAVAGLWKCALAASIFPCVMERPQLAASGPSCPKNLPSVSHPSSAHHLTSIKESKNRDTPLKTNPPLNPGADIATTPLRRHYRDDLAPASPLRRRCCR
jgi:hypothetical protein